MVTKILLRPLNKTDISYFYDWINDPEVIKYSLSLFQKINTKEEIDNWFNKVLQDKISLNMGIVDSNTNNLVGYAGIVSISKQNHSGEFFIFIGDKNMWNKGIGTLATKQIVEMGFNRLNLNRIMLTVSDLNKGAIKAYKKANFIEEGRMRKACFRNSKYHDKIIMSILKND